MEVKTKVEDRTLTISLRGDLDHHAARGLMEQTDRLMEQNLPSKTILDLGGLTFMDSSGIGMIIGRYKTVSALGGKLSIAAPSKEADRILAISGIYRIIHSYKTVEDAVLGINQEVHKNEK